MSGCTRPCDIQPVSDILSLYLQHSVITDMGSPNADVSGILLLTAKERKLCNISRSNLVAAAALAAVLLMSVVSILGPIIVNQSASAGTFPGINGQIVFTSNRDGNDEIYVMNPDGSGQTRLTNNPTIDWNPSWSPDGTKIVFISDRDRSHGDFQIYVMNADGSGVVRLTNNPGWDVEPSWSPDGTKIVFSREGVIHVMNADGTGVTELTGGREPSWSPDGTKIVFVGFDGSIVVMNPDGTEQTILAAIGVRGIAPSWSPDGTKIVFASLASVGGADIIVMNSDGTDPTTLSTGESFLLAGVLNTSWSPDGSKIAISKVTSFQRGSEILVMTPDGTEQTTLTYGTGHDFDPDWGTHPPSVAPPVLTVKAVSSTGFGKFHMYSKILSSDGTILQQGFTPMAFTGESGKKYTVTVANYVGRTFDSWEDGSGERRRTVTLSAGDITLTAFYIEFFSKSGFTPLTFTNTVEVPRTGTVRQGPDLTVNAVSLDGSKILHMWTIINAENIDGTTTTYTVAASNYKDRVFDHWEDGSTARIRSLTISEDTTITAYYMTEPVS